MLTPIAQLISVVTFTAHVVWTLIFVFSVIDFQLCLYGSVGTVVYLLLHLILYANVNARTALSLVNTSSKKYDVPLLEFIFFRVQIIIF